MGRDHVSISVNLDDVENGAAIKADMDADLEMCSGWAWTVVFMCHNVGISVLSDKTMPDFLRRLALWEKHEGLIWRTSAADGSKLVEFPREYVQRMKGFRTNALPKNITTFRKGLRPIAA